MLELQNEMEQMQSLLYTSNESVVSKKKFLKFMVESSAFKSYTVGSKKILKPKVCMFILALKIDKLRELVHVLSFK